MIKRLALLASLTLSTSGMAVSSAHASVDEIQSAYGSHFCLSAQDDQYDNPGINGDSVYMWRCFGGSMQGWNVVVLNNCGGFGLALGCLVEIRSEASGKCLDAENDQYGNPNLNGDRVQLWTCTGASNQTWSRTFPDPSPNTISIASDYPMAPAVKVLDAENAGPNNPNVNGDPVQIWQYNGKSNQQWQ